MTRIQKERSFAAGIKEAIFQAMQEDDEIICFGLGVTDPKGVFGTTKGLEDHFGSNRVFDTPTSENAMTGVAVGAALDGIKSVVTHQRLDFFLLAMDQLVNGAAKWRYMFGAQHSVPITIRLIIGKGWGQGATHSQNLHAWFAHIPGLKVIMPSNPFDAKMLLYSSRLDPNPVIFLEHRWWHDITGEMPQLAKPVDISCSKVVQIGSDITIVSMSYLTLEALTAAKHLHRYGIETEIVDLRSVKPIDFDTIFASLDKTKRLLVLDQASPRVLLPVK